MYTCNDQPPNLFVCSKYFRPYDHAFVGISLSSALVTACVVECVFSVTPKERIQSLFRKALGLFFQNRNRYLAALSIAHRVVCLCALLVMTAGAHDVGCRRSDSTRLTC